MTGACVTVTLALPVAHCTVIVPVRTLESGFGVAEYAIGPVDVPEAPEVMVIHEASTDAVQEHPAPDVVTVAANVPPSTGTACVAGVTTKAQAVGAGAGVPA